MGGEEKRKRNVGGEKEEIRKREESVGWERRETRGKKEEKWKKKIDKKNITFFCGPNAIIGTKYLDPSLGHVVLDYPSSFFYIYYIDI